MSVGPSLRRHMTWWASQREGLAPQATQPPLLGRAHFVGTVASAVEVEQSAGFGVDSGTDLGEGRAAPTNPAVIHPVGGAVPRSRYR